MWRFHACESTIRLLNRTPPPSLHLPARTHVPARHRVVLRDERLLAALVHAGGRPVRLARAGGALRQGGRRRLGGAGGVRVGLVVLLDGPQRGRPRGPVGIRLWCLGIGIGMCEPFPVFVVGCRVGPAAVWHTRAAAKTVGLGAKRSLVSTVLCRPVAQPSICGLRGKCVKSDPHIHVFEPKMEERGAPG